MTPSDRDPVLVAYEGNEYQRKFHILARWGKELDPLENLLIKAKEIARDKLLSKVAAVVAETQAAASTVDEMVEKSIETGALVVPHFYVG
jgi:hypothetical protein